jgi:glucan phosphoethanolaminetransferase (alkaline phosphatase superfamily)
MLYSFWFWLLIFAILSILIAAIIDRGMEKTNGWIWGLFIFGCVLALLGVVLAFYEWKKSASLDSVTPSMSSASMVTPSMTSTSLVSPSLVSPSLYSSPSSLSTPSSSPSLSTSFSPSYYKSMSPMGTPTYSSVNIPQAQRGFSTSNCELSQLSYK